MNWENPGESSGGSSLSEFNPSKRKEKGQTRKGAPVNGGMGKKLRESLETENRGDCFFSESRKQTARGVWGVPLKEGKKEGKIERGVR